MSKKKEYDSPTKRSYIDKLQVSGHLKHDGIDTETYIAISVIKLKKGDNLRWSIIKQRIQNALKREFQDELVI